jgi:hypothetical protein
MAFEGLLRLNGQYQSAKLDKVHFLGTPRLSKKEVMDGPSRLYHI